MKEDDEEWPGCTEARPLLISFQALGYAFLVAEEAGHLVDAILDHRPIANIARRLVANLEELRGRIVGGGFSDDELGSYATAFMEVRFNHVKFREEDYPKTLELYEKDIAP